LSQTAINSTEVLGNTKEIPEDHGRARPTYYVKLKELRIKAMNMTESYDVIIFDRYSGNKSDIPLIRRIPSRGLNILVKVLLRNKGKRYAVRLQDH